VITGMMFYENNFASDFFTNHAPLLPASFSFLAVSPALQNGDKATTCSLCIV